jgi:hypothetical protein
MLHNAHLRKRIAVLVGLVCGHQKSKFFAEYLCSLAGGQPAQLISASFRVKDPTRHHLDHRFEFTCRNDDGAVTGHLYQSEGMSGVWGHDCFKLNACNFCDDITAEVADITFGDAIDEPYSYGTAGANFVIVRSSLMLDLLLKGASAGEIVLDRVPLKAIVERQRGVMLLKRDDLRHRLYALSHKGNASYSPQKRFPARRRFNPLRNWDMEIRDQVRTASRSAYAEYRYQPGVALLVEAAISAVPEAFASSNWQFRLFSYMARLTRTAKHPLSYLARRLRSYS